MIRGSQRKKEKKIVFRVCFRIRLRECVGTESLLLTGVRELKLLKVRSPENHSLKLLA